MENNFLPSLDLKRNFENIKEEIYAAVKGVIDNQQFVLGPEVSEFEQECSSYLGVAHAIGCASGSDALLLSLMALDIAPGDEVITTPFTFFATVSSITRIGAVPVFADIDPVSYNLSPSCVLEKISSRTKAVLPVHLFGQSACLEDIIPELQKRGIKLVEDCAQAFGAWRMFDGSIKRCGSFGDAGAFSFFPTKNLGGYGDGGMVVTNDDATASRLRRLRVHGAGCTYYHDEVGINSRLDAIQAAVLRVHLRHLDECIESRRMIADRYRMLFAERELGEFIRLPQEKTGNYHTYHQYVIRAKDRDRLMVHLENNGIASRIYYPLPLHLQKCFSFLGYEAGDMPESERLCTECLALPIFPGLTLAEQQRVADAMNRFYRNPKP